MEIEKNYFLKNRERENDNVNCGQKSEVLF